MEKPPKEIWESNEDPENIKRIKERIKEKEDLAELIGKPTIPLDSNEDKYSKISEFLEKSPEAFGGKNILEKEKNRNFVYKAIDKNVEPKIGEINFDLKTNKEILKQKKERYAELKSSMIDIRKIIDSTEIICNELKNRGTSEELKRLEEEMLSILDQKIKETSEKRKEIDDTENQIKKLEQKLDNLENQLNN